MREKTIHKMNLNDSPFKLISQGSKTIELRLNDEKRQKLKDGDYINFTNLETQEEVLVEIIKLNLFPDFKTLYKQYDPTAMGYKETDVVDYHDMEEYYSLDKQKLYSALAIEINLVKERKRNEY